MNLSPTQLKLIRVTLFLPTAYYAVLAIAALFIPYEPNPRYFPLPIHFLLYGTSFFFFSIWIYKCIEKSKWKPYVLVGAPILFAIICGVQLVLVSTGGNGLFSANSKFMPSSIDAVMRIIIPLFLLYHETVISKLVDFMFRERAKP